MPADPPPFDCEDEELLKMLHHVLNEVVATLSLFLSTPII